MKTERWIEILAREAGPAPHAPAIRGLAGAASAGLVASVALALLLFGAIPGAMLATPAPWIKLAYTVALAASAGMLTARLSRPVCRLAMPAICLSTVVVTMGLLAAVAWTTNPVAEHFDGLLGQSWQTCPWKILLISMPAMAACLWALRGSAPTQPRMAGMAAGLLAGSVGALGYSLSCLELSLVFVAVWYSVGIGFAAILGALLGAKLLQW
jgi:hypothetical protein